MKNISMFYDIRMKYASRQEKRKIRELAKDINIRTRAITETVRNQFPDYAASFGITGPMAHGEATIFFRNGKPTGSDIDFVTVTKYMSPRRQKSLEKEIRKAFSGSGIQPGPLFFAPSIFKKPDLMFIEYARNGRVLYGTQPKCSKRIPAWEAAKLLTSRCGTLFESMTFRNGIKFSSKFPYAWSKSVLAAGEAFLILEGRYEFTVRERMKKIRQSVSAQKIPGFLEMHKEAFVCRYSGKPPKNKNFLADTTNALSAAFEETAKNMAEKSGRKVSELGAPFPSVIATRLFYLMNTAKKGRPRVPLTEPLVEEFEEMGKMFAMLKEGKLPTEKQRLHATHLWKTAERFWLPY